MLYSATVMNQCGVGSIDWLQQSLQIVKWHTPTGQSAFIRSSYGFHPFPYSICLLSDPSLSRVSAIRSMQGIITVKNFLWRKSSLTLKYRRMWRSWVNPTLAHHQRAMQQCSSTHGQERPSKVWMIFLSSWLKSGCGKWYNSDIDNPTVLYAIGEQVKPPTFNVITSSTEMFVSSAKNSAQCTMYRANYTAFGNKTTSKQTCYNSRVSRIYRSSGNSLFWSRFIPRHCVITSCIYILTTVLTHSASQLQLWTLHLSEFLAQSHLQEIWICSGEVKYVKWGGECMKWVGYNGVCGFWRKFFKYV